jgi:hypothetical protein
MIRTPTGYTLDTGRNLRANQGLLCPTDEGLLAEGYDGTVDAGWGEDDCDEPALTAAERTEIAAYMIRRWQEWAEPTVGWLCAASRNPKEKK